MIASLLKLNVQDHVEKKNGLTYLSWAWAWAEALKADPTATFHVDTFQRADGTTIPYMDINGTAMVWVRTTLFGKEMTCMLPVMDHRNKPIQNPDAFQVNTAIMRCLTKCLAMHGLGLYIYAGEDLPEDDGVVPPPKPAPKTEKPPEPVTPAKPPAKTEGEGGRFSINITAKPNATAQEWIDLASEAIETCMNMATSIEEVSQIWHVNPSLWDKIKKLDFQQYTHLITKLKGKKESFK
jgi:acetylornithine deacetylase/succinyl-diaminopimelate desuccinylase-like protein